MVDEPQAHNWEPVSEPAAETPPELADMGVFLAGDVVLCNDCNFIGTALRRACRRCAGESLSYLQAIVNRARAEALLQNPEASAAWLEAWGEVEQACGGVTV